MFGSVFNSMILQKESYFFEDQGSTSAFLHYIPIYFYLTSNCSTLLWQKQSNFSGEIPFQHKQDIV